MPGVLLIVGLEPLGDQLIAALHHYCHVTGHEIDLDRIDQMYHNVMSEIMAAQHFDPATFMAQVAGLPTFHNLHYKETPIDYQVVAPLRGVVQATAVAINERLREKRNLQPALHYHMVAATPTYLTIRVINNAVPAEFL